VDAILARFLRWHNQQAVRGLWLAQPESSVFSEHYVLDAPLLRSLFHLYVCLYVCLFVCLSVCDALELWVTQDFFQNHPMGQRYGSVVKKTARKYSQPFPQWFIWKKSKKSRRSLTNILFYLGNDTRSGQLTHALLNGVNSNDLEWLRATAKFSTTQSIVRPLRQLNFLLN